MKTVWRVIVRTVFWSYERGTWPYDVAVALIVVFVLLSPRHWFHDQPPMEPSADSSMVQLRASDPGDGVETYRIDARVLTFPVRTPESELEHQLHEAVSKSVASRHKSRFQITRIEPVRGDDGSVSYYDVSIKP